MDPVQPSNAPAPAVAVMPTSGAVDAQTEVATFGLRVHDAGEFNVQIEGSAPLAATLIDEDGVSVSTLADGGGANPLAFKVALAPGAYTLHVRAAEKDAAATMRVGVYPTG